MNTQAPIKHMKKAGVEAYRSMPIEFGRMKATVFGGPFREYVPGQRRLVSVKMAKEVNNPADIVIPSEDFGTPTHPVMHAGIRKALQAIFDGNDLYVGCGYGIGRTGLFMACLAKVMIEYEASRGDFDGARFIPDPVGYVRDHYLAHAVETQGQQDFIAQFQTRAHIEWIKSQLEPKVIEIEREVERIIYTFNPWLAFWQGVGKR